MSGVVLGRPRAPFTIPTQRRGVSLTVAAASKPERDVAAATARRLAAEMADGAEGLADWGLVDVEDPADVREALWPSLYAFELAWTHRKLVAWEGVRIPGDGYETPAPITAATVRKVMRDPKIAVPFVAAVELSDYWERAEGKGSASSPGGSGEEARAGAGTASGSSGPAPAAAAGATEAAAP